MIELSEINLICFKGTPPPFPVFLRNGWAKIYETLRADRSRWVEQKLSLAQNCQMPPSGSFTGHKGLKWPKVFPLAKIETLFFRAETFFVVTRTKSGCGGFFFFEKYQIRRSGEAKYWRSSQKLFFFERSSFLKAAKFYRNKISK